MEMKIVKKVEVVTKVDKIRRRIKIIIIFNIIETKLRWFGDLVRMKEDRSVKVIW